MYFKKIDYTNEMEILVTAKNLVTFTHTVVATGVAPDAEGKKIVPAGSFIDATGKVMQPGADNNQFTGVPVGVLYRTVDVTNGDMPCSLIVEGYLRKDRVIDNFAELARTNAETLIKTNLPKITFR